MITRMTTRIYKQPVFLLSFLLIAGTASASTLFIGNDTETPVTMYTTGGTFLGPGSIRIDMGVTRKFQLRERQTLEFRAEMFNMPNHVNPGLPDTTLTSATLARS